MNNSYSDDDIEDYLEGRMDETTRVSFESQMANDKALAEEVTFYKAFRQVAYDVFEEEALVGKIKQIEDNLTDSAFYAPIAGADSKKKSNDTMRVVRRTWSIAASLVVLLTLGGVGYWKVNQYTNSSLLAQHFQPFEMATTTRTADSTVQRALDLGMEAFLNGAYEDAENAFLQIPPNHQLYVESRYYLAHTYHQLGNQERSIELFRQVVNAKDLRFTERAQWDLVKKYLEMDAPEQQIHAQLQPILDNPQHAFYNNAVALENALDHFWRRMSI